jgi:hypothetical protein
MSTGLAGCSVGPRISRGARKLFQTLRVIKKKNAPNNIRIDRYLMYYLWFSRKCNLILAAKRKKNTPH